ncbi:MAG TPA: TfoX/Sxy family protein [Propionibacteriaceae bacterium]|jgi:TfoX/Sxy family transcriptional regulator of competence genes
MTQVPAGDQVRELVDRVRAFLPDRQLREVRMFGVLAVMVDDAMAVAVHKDGSLLVRVDPSEDARLLESPGASRPEMGAGRSMGEGWIQVEARALRSDPALNEWVEAAIRYLHQRRETGRTGRSLSGPGAARSPRTVRAG